MRHSMLQADQQGSEKGLGNKALKPPATPLDPKQKPKPTCLPASCTHMTQLVGRSLARMQTKFTGQGIEVNMQPQTLPLADLHDPHIAVVYEAYPEEMHPDLI